MKIVQQILEITDKHNYPESPEEQAKVQQLKNEIDQMVYELYGLTKEEIAIVEGKSN